MNKVRIVGAIVDKTAGITLYLDSGKELQLPPESWRTKAIMDQVKPALARHQSVEIDLDTFSIEKRVEEKTNGFVRFIRKKWSDFKSMFGGELPDATVGTAETIVAVVNGKEIPGMEKLERQMEYAALKDAKGFQRFMDRLSKVIDKRGHSVQELLNFMERGDLPIADDGSIVAYKMLYAAGDGYYVDPHTRLVRQRVGSLVTMDEKLVDPSRRLECSTGLHVARRDYVKSFHGDTITLIKIGPEDVIAVPLYERSKMRVCAYHLVVVLPQEGAALIRQNRPMTSHALSAKALADVIAGDHIGIIEHVIIGAAHGGDIKVVPVGEAAKNVVDFKPASNNGEIKALDDGGGVSTVTVKEVRDAVRESMETPEVATVAVETVREMSQPVESAQDRRNRIKREKRAAAKAIKADVKKDTAPPAKPKKAAPKTQSAVIDKPASEHPKADEVRKMHADGKSKRQIEAALGLSRRSIVKIIGNG